MRKYEILSLIAGLAIVLILFSCKKDEKDIKPYEQAENIYSGDINVDLNSVPFNTLSEYNFFDGDLAEQNPVNGVLPYQPASSLFN